MKTIESVREKLKYHDSASLLSVYWEWIPIVYQLQEEYAKAGMAKETSVCRWIVNNRKRPSLVKTIDYWNFKWEPNWSRMAIDSSVPFYLEEFEMLGLHYDTDLLGCLDKLFAIPNKYLDRFELKGELSGSK